VTSADLLPSQARALGVLRGCTNRGMVRRSKEAAVTLSSALQADRICNTKFSLGSPKQQGCL